MTSNKPQIAIVMITRYGKDQAIFMDGQLILTADPGKGDAVASIHTVAEALAGRFATHPEIIEFGPNENWTWDDVTEQLLASGLLNAQAPVTDYRVDFKTINKMGAITAHTTSFSATTYAKAVAQLLETYSTIRNAAVIEVMTPEEVTLPPLFHTREDMYTLSPRPHSTVWISVGNLDVYLKRTDEGVVVDLFSEGSGPRESIASTYAFWTEATTEEAA